VINGMHVVIYSNDAEKDREFFKNVLKFPHVDVGGGWLIFAAPPSELAFHPTDRDSKHETYLMCDDVYQQVEDLEKEGYSCSDIKDEGWGLLTSLRLPGGSEIGLYQPKHDLPPRNA